MSSFIGKSCYFCEFYHRDKHHQEGDVTDGDCRFKPPVVLEEGTSFPRVTARLTWCGEFKRDIKIENKPQTQNDR